ncbi:MAG TPA: hypothetical protein PKM41_12500 [Deltaproteobacteria bacterium]|jgi:hypothetical protein|nr:hypothetical protein [Deltaproteobacteria bacterium]HOI08366.1 hypothetical protein [Deltaproteobacteria bacterium]
MLQEQYQYDTLNEPENPEERLLRRELPKFPGGRYSRPLSFNERLFLALDEICPPVCNQLFFDGTGILDPDRWTRAVELASSVNPGSRLVLKGHLGFSRWVDTGITPRVREVDGSRWNGTGAEGAPFLQDRLTCREGPTCEVVLVHGPTPRVVFRTHHGVMDGRGTLLWAEDVFRALRGDPVLGAFSTLTDHELARSFQKRKLKPFPANHIAPTGRASGQGQGVVWKRVQVRGGAKNILARCIMLAAQEAWRVADGPVRFGIPVDLRPRLGNQRSTANLSFAIYVEVRPETTIGQIADDIASQISQGREGMIFRGDSLYRHVPIRLMASKARKIIQSRHARGVYSLSGIISNLGRVNLDQFQGGGFQAEAFWAIPPRNEYHPFFLAMAGHGDTVELILSISKVLADNGRIEQALEHIALGLHGIDKGGYREHELFKTPLPYRENLPGI